MKLSNSFTISLLGLASLLALGLAKGTDVSMAISGIVLSYVGARQAKDASDVWATKKKEKPDGS